MGWQGYLAASLGGRRVSEAAAAFWGKGGGGQDFLAAFSMIRRLAELPNWFLGDPAG